jgi:CheY-like chemotaxis protein
LSKPFTHAELLDAVQSVLCTLTETPFADLMLHPEKLEMALNSVKTSRAEEPALEAVWEDKNTRPRILVVDDNNDVRQLSIDVLVGSGYEAEGVTDGAAGWEALQTYDYDLVITDNKMPRMTGIEMIEKLRSARIEVPIIMATGNLPTHEFVRRPWLKPTATLERPFSNNDLLETVRNVLGTDNGGDDSKETPVSKYL